MDPSFREVLKADTEIKQNKNFIFKPTEDECSSSLIHVCYSSALDTYIRRSSDNEKTESWLDCTYSCTNMFRKVEYDWDMTYLARDDVRSPPGGEVSWKFDLTDADCTMDKLELRAPCALYEDGCVIWTICTDKRNFVQTGKSLNDFVTFELEGATSLSITAFLTGGLGCCLYQHAQLFRQERYDETVFPLEIKLFIESEPTRSIRSMMEETLAERCGEITKGYIFTPNDEECINRTMCISYDVSDDCYTRHSPDNATLSSWLEYTYSSTNMVRKLENDEGEACLARKEDADFGKVSWKFDVRDSGFRLKLLRMKAPSDVWVSGSVVWLICSGKQCYMETGDELDKFMTFELEGSTELSITAVLCGDTEHGRQAQLFKNRFSIELKLEENPQLDKRALKRKSEEMDFPKEVPDAGNGFVFRPTEEEMDKRMMHICYSCTNDTYSRKFSSNEKLYSWQNGTHSYTNVFRKENTYKWMTYIVREDSDQRAEVTWKFDVNETDLRMNKIEIRASSAAFETGSVTWLISTEKDIYFSASLQEASVYNLSDASSLTITARLEGGEGSNAWEHSQLFPQPTQDVASFPFEVKIYIDLPRPISAVGGNIDASSWRQPKGSFGIPAEICANVNKSFVFKPTEEECANKTMHIRYNCATDNYSRELSPDDQMPSWLDYTFSSTNMYRKEEFDHDMVYLARIEGTQFAEVTWKFDVTGTGLKMESMELKAQTALYQDASVLWTVRAEDRAYIRTAHYFKNMNSETFDLDGALTMTITAFLTGGKGLVAWQHSQIFRQIMYDHDTFPFDVELLLEPSSEAVQIAVPEGIPATPADIFSRTDYHYVFKPTEHEIETKLMHVSYNTTNNSYIRRDLLLKIKPRWEDRVYSSINLWHKKDHDKQMSYLGRTEGTQFAEVTWKFDVTDTDLFMDTLELKAISNLRQDGCVIWTIQSDEKKFIQTGESLMGTRMFELCGSKALSITAFLAGGKGEEAWKHTQLFQQRLDDAEPTEFPFELKLFLT